jgi:chromosome segregation ATPase
MIETKNREISTIRDDYNKINTKKNQIMDQINQNTRSIEDFNLMLEDSRSKKEKYQRELDEKTNLIDKGKASLSDLDKMYKEKIDNIERLKAKETELSNLRDQTQDGRLKIIMNKKELYAIDPSE